MWPLINVKSIQGCNKIPGIKASHAGHLGPRRPCTMHCEHLKLPIPPHATKKNISH